MKSSKDKLFTYEKRPDKKYLFGVLECDTVFTGDFSKEGIIHTVENVLRVICVFVLLTPYKDTFFGNLSKILAIIIVGVKLWYIPDENRVGFKLW